MAEGLPIPASPFPVPIGNNRWLLIENAKYKRFIIHDFQAYLHSKYGNKYPTATQVATEIQSIVAKIEERDEIVTGKSLYAELVKECNKSKG